MGRLLDPTGRTDQQFLAVTDLGTHAFVATAGTRPRDANPAVVARRAERDEHEFDVGGVPAGLVLAGREPDGFPGVDGDALRRSLEGRRPVEDDEQLLLLGVGLEAAGETVALFQSIPVERNVRQAQFRGEFPTVDPLWRTSGPRRRRCPCRGLLSWSTKRLGRG
ncbi:hypothetical protein VB773_00530 [Haloarculaceae archaeon H-GB2-1]|nr:hypothetical protein [Haloarculaceae archaeon H-GB2-1]